MVCAGPRSCSETEAGFSFDCYILIIQFSERPWGELTVGISLTIKDKLGGCVGQKAKEVNRKRGQYWLTFYNLWLTLTSLIFPAFWDRWLTCFLKGTTGSENYWPMVLAQQVTSRAKLYLKSFLFPAFFFFFNKEVWSSPAVRMTRMSQRHPWWMICTKMRAEKGSEDQCWLICVHLWCSQLIYLSHPTPPHQVESADRTQHLMHGSLVFCHWAVSLALAFLRQILAV